MLMRQNEFHPQGIPVDWGIYSTTHSPTVMVSRAN